MSAVLRLGQQEQSQGQLGILVTAVDHVEQHPLRSQSRGASSGGFPASGLSSQEPDQEVAGQPLQVCASSVCLLAPKPSDAVLTWLPDSQKHCVFSSASPSPGCAVATVFPYFVTLHVPLLLLRSALSCCA